MHTINSRVLIFILLMFFINTYYMYATKVHKDALQKINNISKNLKEQLNIIYYDNRFHRLEILIKNKKNIFFKSNKIDKIVKNAKSYIGTPYKYGGSSKMGIDCSSFISNIFEIHNINLPRISYKQAKKGVPVSKNELQKGDLLFFSTNFMEKTIINHVGIVLNMKKNNILFIHSSSSNGVIISHIMDPYWTPKFIFARRIT